MFRYIFISLSSLLLVQQLNAQEDISALLEQYKQESELSKITKKESAGILDVFTRDELEKMQAHNLADILKIIKGLYLQKGSNATTLMAKPTINKVSFSNIRLYINDHDMSSSTFNSAFIIWGDMPIEYIDHIEIYKATSSIEFGNETSALIIKLYTKKASREHGGKVRTMVDERGGYDLSAYYAEEISEDFSYFLYANGDDIKRDEYSNYYKDKEYKFKNDKDSYNIYGNFLVHKWLIEAGLYHKNSDSFIGRGIHQTPTGGELDAYQYYTHLTRKFENGLKVQFSYDYMNYERTYKDPNGMLGANQPLMDAYLLDFKDEIYTATIEKTFHSNKNQLLIGGFFKRKKFGEHGVFEYIKESDVPDDIRFGNSLNLYSLYIEDTYSFDATTAFITSLKGDFYRYDKEVKNQDLPVFKAGITKKLDNLMLKLFYTRSYIALPFYEVYGPYDIQLLANPNLDPSTQDIYAFSAKYKSQHNILELNAAHLNIDDVIRYTSDGFANTGKTQRYTRMSASYTYMYDNDNKVSIDYFTGKNSDNIEQSPKYGINLRVFNSFDKFDIYNELLFRPSYTYDYKTKDGLKTISMDNSYEYSLSIKYHYNQDLSIGFKGDNIFDSGYEQGYRGLDYSIPVTQQKFWLNMEYLF
jgi:iron complex outermembrane receptor protein